MNTPRPLTSIPTSGRGLGEASPRCLRDAPYRSIERRDRSTAVTYWVHDHRKIIAVAFLVVLTVAAVIVR